MPRTRLLNPRFFADSQIAKLPAITRLAALALLTIADKEGRIECIPEEIRAQILPYEAHDIDKILDELLAIKYLEKYTAKGKQVLVIKAFLKYQKPHPREAPSNLPPRRAKGSPKANLRQALGTTKDTPRRSVSVSVSNSVSNSVSVSQPRGDGANHERSPGNGDGQKTVLDNSLKPKPKSKPPERPPGASADYMDRITALAKAKTIKVH